MVTGDQNSWMVLSSLSSSKRPVNDGAGGFISPAHPKNIYSPK